MGIDLIDIEFRIAKTFEISVKGEFLDLMDDQDILVGALYTHILKKVGLRDHARSDLRLNYALWRHMQDLIQDVTDVEVDHLELKTPLRDVFPPKTRRELWQILREDCPYNVPELEYPAWVPILGTTVALAAVAFEQFQVAQLPGWNWFWPLAGLLGIWMVAETYAKLLHVFDPWRVRFPANIKTVKDLCRLILSDNYEKFCGDAEISLDDRANEIWRKLKQILAEVLFVDEDKITFRSRLIQDLGLQ